MAANEYYHNPNTSQPPTYDQLPDGQGLSGHPAPVNPNSNAPGYALPGPSHQADASAPYHNRQSQYSLQYDNGVYGTAGRVADGDHYAENIPLKAQPQYSNNPEWMHQQTHYPPPSPGGLGGRPRVGNQRKPGFFRKKPAWVTWALTVAQIVVFIVELVKNGESSP